MKPTNEQAIQWAREAGAAKFVFSDGTTADQMQIVGTGFYEKLAARAYAAGAEAMQERCAKEIESVGELFVREGGASLGEVIAFAAAIRALGDEE